MEALIAVDVQRDFCSDGALAVPDGDAVVPEVNRLMAELGLVVATRDWHPPDHASFAPAGGPWPAHCVRDTAGAELHPELNHGAIDLVLDKGRERELEGYSAFERTELARWLRDRGVETVHVAGLALDYCVRATALDARAAGFTVILHRDATRAVEATPGDAERAVEALRAAGVEVRS